MAAASVEKNEETIDIIGTTCIGCARTLENEFRKFEDIEYTVNFNDKNIIVKYSPVKYTRKTFEEVMESHGYKIKEK
jgi:copper chaperone CopZ